MDRFSEWELDDRNVLTTRFRCEACLYRGLPLLSLVSIPLYILLAQSKQGRRDYLREVKALLAARTSCPHAREAELPKLPDLDGLMGDLEALDNAPLSFSL